MNLTGWIFPNGQFVRIHGDHADYLTKNSDELKKRFGVELSEMNLAFRAGFVRIRFRPESGNIIVEANSAKWLKTRRTVQRLLTDYSHLIDGLTICLRNDIAAQVDSITVAGLRGLPGQNRFESIEEAIDSLRFSS